MGILYYGDAKNPIQIDDLALAHLKVVIATKLRRNESFTLSWRHPDGDAAGRSTIWLHPSIPLRFTFEDPEAPELQPEWISAMSKSANSSGGITLLTADMIPKDDIDAEAQGSQPPRQNDAHPLAL